MDAACSQQRYLHQRLFCTDPAQTRAALQLLGNSRLHPRPLAVAALVGVLEQRQGRYAAALTAFDELWKMPTATVDSERTFQLLPSVRSLRCFI
jgi:hypothetical protein